MQLQHREEFTIMTCRVIFRARCAAVWVIVWTIAISFRCQWVKFMILMRPSVFGKAEVWVCVPLNNRRGDRIVVVEVVGIEASQVFSICTCQHHFGHITRRVGGDVSGCGIVASEPSDLAE